MSPVDHITIPLGQGKTAVVSWQDADASQHNWHDNSGYAARYAPGTKGGKMYLHRVVMTRMVGRPLQKGEEVDHINRNKLDNRRANLRLTDRAGNNRNRGPVRRKRKIVTKQGTLQPQVIIVFVVLYLLAAVFKRTRRN